jgi:lactoylglutathione lyase
MSETTTGIGAPLSGGRLKAAALRVRDLDRSLAFYVDALGMRLLRRKDYPKGQFTLAFLGFGDDPHATQIELTHNWGEHDYELGTAFGQIAIGVDDVYAACRHVEAAGVTITRPPGPMSADPTDVIAFLVDPDGYRVEFVQEKQ